MLNKNRQNQNLDIDCLLPNGLLISLNVSKDLTLSDILTKLNQEASNLLQSQIEYKNVIFTSVNEEAQTVEFYDLTKKFSDLNIFNEFPFFKLIDTHKPDYNAKSLKSELNNVIGFCLDDLESAKNMEQNEFRLEMMRIVKNRLEKENEANSDLRFASIFSPNLELDSTRLLIKKSFKPQKRSTQNLVEIKIFIFGQRTRMESFNLIIRLDQTPEDILEFVKLRIRESEDDLFLSYIQSDDLVLNVCGYDEILYGNFYQFGSYKYVQKCISSNKKPTFYINTKQKLRENIKANDTNLIASIDKVIGELEIKIENFLKTQPQIDNEPVLSWDVNQPFTILFDYIQYYLSSRDYEKIFFKACLYNGLEQIGEEVTSKTIESEEIYEYHYLTFKQKIEFKVKISELHRSSKLCLTLNYLSKKNKEVDTIGWIVLNLFDYKSNLINGKKNLYLWPSESASVYTIIQEKTFFNLCLSGVSGQNPNKEYTLFKVEFLNENNIYYPTKSQITNYFHKSFREPQENAELNNTLDKNLIKIIEIILSKDPLTDLSERDKNLLWTNRIELLRNYPNSLPRLLQSVDWSNKQEVVEIYNLLSRWPILKPVVALELLSCKYFDIEIRNFAVRCLDKLIQDEEVQSYLLQLVQATKNEIYLNNDLSKFLIFKALNNQRIGFDLYWQLKSEMKNLRHKTRFGIMLEAYCRGVGSNIKILTKQIEAISLLTALSIAYKSNREHPFFNKETFIKEQFETTQTIKRLSHFVNPMNRSHILGTIDTTKCRVLSSKKCPIYLSYLNTNNFADLTNDNYNVIFKHGDDLRQDMLTIQMLKLMNTIWKNEGLELNMLIYDVTSTGHLTGFIEAVNDSETIFKIQQDAGFKSTYQKDSTQILKWLSYNNPNEKFNKAIDNFSKSCAAFCVATFILGIGDRHPDNIMINKDGKLFHIDFGHFLGHFKTKYGIKRERVPFVLTEDFTKVIAKGALEPSQTFEFKNFRDLCEEAYMIIRQYSYIFLNLFTLMLSSDMPELQSIEDISYFRNKLVLDESEDKARKFFNEQFERAVKLSYTTKLDWVFHAINKKK